MANPDILITPGQGTIGFSGTNTGTIQLRVAESGDIHFEGDQGSLLSLSDDLSDSLFSVNDAAGMPVFEVFADDTIKAYRNNEAKLEIDPDNNRIRLRDNLLVSGDLTVSGDITSASASHEATSYTASTHVSGLSGYFGKVGIGSSANPDNAQLYIAHGPTSVADVILESAAGRKTRLSAHDATNYLHVGSASNHDFHIVRNNVVRIATSSTQTTIWDSTPTQVLTVIGGKLGVMESTPEATLQVNGDASISGSLSLDGDSDSGFTQGLIIKRHGSSHYGYLNMVGGALNINNTQSVTKIMSNGSTTMTVKNANVGIGTTNPGTLLEVYSSAPSISIKDGGVYGTNATPHLQFTDAHAAIGYVGVIANAGTLDTWAVSGDLRFAAGNAVAMQIKTDGTVGIGTAAAKSTLHIDFTRAGEHISAGITVSNINGATNDFAPIYFGNHGGDRRKKAGIGLKRLGSYGRGSLHFAVDSNADDADVSFANDTKMVIDKDGQVGIGTTVPNGDGLLEVDGNIRLGDGTHRNIIGPTNATLGIYANPNDSNEGIKFSTDGGSTIEMFLQDGGKVGIGTTSPDTEFHIVGNRAGYNGTYNYAGVVARITNLAAGTPAGNTAGLEFGVSAGTNASARIDAIRQSDGSIDMRFFGGTTSSITGASPQMYIDGGNGNVGIGTTSPDTQLDLSQSVDGPLAINIHNQSTNAAADSAISFETQGATDFTIGIDRSLGTFSMCRNATLGTNEIVRIDPAGTISAPTVTIDADVREVGIGTTNPAQVLHVSGNIRVGGGDAYNRIEFNRYGPGSATIVGGIGFYSDANFYMGGHPSVGPTAGNKVFAYGFGNDIHIGDNTNGPIITVKDNGKVGIGKNGSFFTSNNPAHEPQALLVVSGDASITGELKIDDNVGIGTSTPESYSNYKALTISDSVGGQVYFKSTSSSVTAYAGADSNGAYFAAKTNHELRLRTNNADRLVITKAGTIRVQDQTVVEGTNSRADIILPDGTGIAIGSAYTFANIYGLGGDLYLRANSYPANIGEESSIYLSTSTAAGGQAGHVVVSGGKVGIATETPRSYLHIGGAFSDESDVNTTNGISIKQASTDSRYGIYMERAGERKGYYIGIGGSKDSLTFERNNAGTKSDVMALTRDGLVGIGTTNPVAKLEVNAGNVRVDDDRYVEWGGTNARIGGSNAGDYVFFLTNNEDRMRIISNGNVGIGENAPTGKLHIYQSGDSQPAFLVEGSQGSLFSVEDTLTGSLMSVNDIAGLPVFEAFDDGTIVMGQYNSGDFVVTGNNIGIGTSNPLAKLHLYGTGTPPGIILECADNAQSMNIDYYNNVGAVQSRIGYDEGAGQFSIQPNQSTVGTHVYFKYDGKVGVGLSAPQAKLQVDGDTSISGQLVVGGGQTSESIKLLRQSDTSPFISWYSDISTREAYIQGSPSHFYIVNQNDNNIELMTNGAVNFTVSPTATISRQKVGIGTTNPAELLTVSGANATVRINTPTTAGSDTAAYTFGLNAAADLAGMRLDYTDRVASGLALFVHPLYGYPISLTPANDKDILLNVLGNGKVGIGTTNPSEKLEIYGNGAALRFEAASTDQDPSAVIKFAENSTTDNHFRIEYDGSSNHAANGALIFGGYGATQTDEFAMINREGQMMVGNFHQGINGKPQATFTVSGDASITGELKVDGAIHSNNNVFANNYFANNYVYHNGDVDTYYGFLQNEHIVFRTNGTDRVLIDGAGHTSITGDLRVSRFIKHGGDEGTKIDFGSTEIDFFANNVKGISVKTTEVAINDNSADVDFRVESNNKTHMLFVEGETDRVGIGTSDPVAALHIHGNSDNGDDDCQLVISDADTTAGSKIPSILFRSLNDAGGSYISTNRIRGTKGFGMQFATETSSEGTLSTVMTLDNSQNAGIGTTSPDGRLHTLSDGTGIIVANKTITGNAFEVFGVQGNLLTVTDDLSDSLFSVNDVAGMPVFEVFADDRIKSYRNNESKFEIDPDNNQIRLRDNAFVSGVLTTTGAAVIGGGDRFTAGGTHALSVKIANNECFGLGVSDTDLTYFRRLAAGHLQLQTYNSANAGVFSLQSYGGEVHIGGHSATAPSGAKLVVNGDAQISGHIRAGAHGKDGMRMGHWPPADGYGYLQNDALSPSNGDNYAVLQSNNGDTYINAADGRTLFLRVENSTEYDCEFTATGVLFNRGHLPNADFAVRGDTAGTCVFAVDAGGEFTNLQSAKLKIAGTGNADSYLKCVNSNGAVSYEPLSWSDLPTIDSLSAI